MTNYPQSLPEALVSAVKLCDAASVRNILDGVEHLPFTCSSNDGSPLHVICNLVKSQLLETEWESCIFPEKRKLIIYMLIDAGFDTELVDKSGNTCLFYAVRNESAHICDILLQCGADMWAHTELLLKAGHACASYFIMAVDLSTVSYHLLLFDFLLCKVSVFEYVNQMSSSEIRSIFNKYSPGLWRAVESEDIYQVRKLVNLWCRTDLHKNGVNLKDIALGTGNEEIISLILGIFDSMKLVYHIYAKNIKAVSKLLETNRQRVRLDLRKMSDRGAPILYYLIKSEDIAAIELFIKHGCQLYSIMQDDLGYDMPVLFSALNTEVSASVVQALLPPGKLHQEELLYKILYRGHTVLEIALEKDVNLEVFKVLIDRGGPLLLCERNQANQTVRDLALLADKTSYMEVIDLILLNWIVNINEYPGRREKLALFGLDLEDIKKEFEENICVNEYFTRFQMLQFQMKQLSDSIENGDMNTFLKLKENISVEDENFLWHGRIVGDGMPLLHKAVLYNRLNMVEIILDEKPPKESIDSLFDQNRRTALHYAYASASMKDIKKLLMSYGCSEHVLDKVNREPLDFRDKQDTADMICLLDRLKSKDFSTPEVNPWDNNEVILSCNYLSSSACCQQSNATCGRISDPSDYESESFSEISEDENPNTKSCIII